jgi:hypothetical protein
LLGSTPDKGDKERRSWLSSKKEKPKETKERERESFTAHLGSLIGRNKSSKKKQADSAR